MNIVRRQEQKAVPATASDWDPFRAMREMMRWDPFREIGPAFSGDTRGMFMPDVDVKETESAYIFKADLPGMKEKDIEVSFTGNRLTLSGKREDEKREEKDNYFTCERSYGSFTRSFTLPAGTDSQAAGAELKEGVLTITVPKKPDMKPQRIPVNGGEAKPQAKA